MIWYPLFIFILYMDLVSNINSKSDDTKNRLIKFVIVYDKIKIIKSALHSINPVYFALFSFFFFFSFHSFIGIKGLTSNEFLETNIVINDKILLCDSWKSLKRARKRTWEGDRQRERGRVSSWVNKRKEKKNRKNKQTNSKIKCIKFEQ